ncbi:LOW QUALITY PROTEIN: pleckstrin homology domain-containing family G member 4B-like [Brachionichthys hirsutus]|uniref:LOW QUALITY PROTEIN: pleckstrin homology domain-containing family G member 4B-like n=1 Tax=Brachionichthys hirsutus TaxID=412623 RepID=UPI0036049123
MKPVRGRKKDGDRCARLAAAGTRAMAQSGSKPRPDTPLATADHHSLAYGPAGNGFGSGKQAEADGKKLIFIPAGVQMFFVAPTGQNLEPLEGSIQNLLSALYPPFEATAPTLLGQLFQIIDSRYQGDALRCLLDFLVPAKHILDAVQQAACAQYSDVLFLCAGWPLCLRDQIVIHLAPVNPLLLQPGDFYLQVAPFCDQSARIVVCSLLEEEGLRVELVEETPIPEIFYPCIFSRDWLEEINQGRQGTPLSQCLLATEQGVVRLPWEHVALPEFVGVPKCAGGSMASAPPSYHPLPPPLPNPPPLPHFSENSLSNCSFPIVAPSSHPSAFSVETRICPAKHGIAVSLCLVDTRAASSSRSIRIKGSETERKPVGLVSPNTWGSCFTGTDTEKRSTVSNKCTSESRDTHPQKSAGSGVIVSDNTDQEKHKVAHTSKRGSADRRVAEGDYIDIMEAHMLFGKVQSVHGGQQQLEMPLQPLTQGEPKLQRYSHENAQMELHWQSQQCHAQSQAHVQLPGKPKKHSGSEARVSSGPAVSSETGPTSTLHHSQSQRVHRDSAEAPQCARTVRFSENPCTPCMRRRQGGEVSRAQELRCRYRDSYQAAIQNPVCNGQTKEREHMLTVMEEDWDFSHCDDRLPEPDSRDPWCKVQEAWLDPGTQHQSSSSVNRDICKESGERNTVPCRKPGDANAAPCMDFRGTRVSTFSAQPEQTPDRNALQVREQREARAAKALGLHNVKGTNLTVAINANKALPCLNEGVSDQHHGLPVNSAEGSEVGVNLRPRERLRSRADASGADPNVSVPQNRQESVSDGRLSSLSTAVVDTSEKCELVLVEGQNVRRENTDPSEEIPQLHVVKCKKTTAFRLVSPKIIRRTASPISTEGAQHSSLSVTSRQGHRVKSNPPATAQRNSQPASSHPRPDSLPLGCPDPSTHPLYSGVASLTGGRDRTGRAIVELYGDHQGWSPAVTSQQLFKMLLYFHSIARREIREAGMMIIFDAKKTNPQPQLYKALMAFQEHLPHIVNSVVLLVKKESSPRPEKCPGIQTELVTSIKALLKLVEVSQLSSRLNGTLSHSHCGWMELHQKLFLFVSDLHEASSLLLRAIGQLERPQRMDTVQAVQQCMMDQRTLMRDVLKDSRLVSLQREGGAILARLKKESDLRYPHYENLSDAVDSVTSLYNHVEEQAHILVQRTNMSLEHLEHLVQLRELEGLFMQMQEWFHVEGDRHLLEAESVRDSGERMEQILNSFTSFLIEANDRRHHAMTLVSEAERLQQSGLSYPETEVFGTLVCTFKSGLEDFLCTAEACGRELQVMVNVCDFCEQATALASECTEYLDLTQSRIPIMQDLNQTSTPVSKTNSHPIHDRESVPSSAFHYQSDNRVAQGPAPSITGVPPSGNDVSILQTFQDRFLQFSLERFQEMKVQASSLRGSRGMRVWNIAWLRCQEAKQQLQERIKDLGGGFLQQTDSGSWCDHHYVDVVSTSSQTQSPGGQSLVVQSMPGPLHPQWESIVSGEVDLAKRRQIQGNNGSNSTTAACSDSPAKSEDRRNAGESQGSKVNPQSPHRSGKKTDAETRRRQSSRARRERDAAAMSQSQTVGCQWFPWGRSTGVKSVSEDSSTTGVATSGPATPPEQRVRSPSSCSHHGQPSCRILQEAQKFQISRHGSFCSDESCISDLEAAGGSGTLCCKHSSLPAGSYEGAFCFANPQESVSNAMRLRRVLEELVFTEREYVRSLGYILMHYLPLLDGPDIPQDLRGKRGVIFSNLEKLYDFHSRYFLPELEACQREPAMVARCFLRHSESLGLYALYSKNKPQSDALILHRRHDIFKRKQQELGDMMDLSSYLLRPIQRISKYSLLLQDILALAGTYRQKDLKPDTLLSSSVRCQDARVPDLTSSEREREKAEIQAAADLVRLQMRHGNDLLTMDAIKDCDVNLKEQGQLIRQDEFTVFLRKKKCVRRVFLFEDLVLFSKTKKTDIGNDVYVYKHSFKTSDIGITHHSSVNSLCFEIWFRRRKSEDTYTLKAPCMEVKTAWTSDLERILWDQATQNRGCISSTAARHNSLFVVIYRGRVNVPYVPELRMQERVFMGMGRKPFTDIQPSDAAICDRAVSCSPPGRIPVACCSHRGLECPRPHSIGSGSTASTTISQSSSSSGRGSLPPAGYPGNQSNGIETSGIICSSIEDAVENELIHHHHHLHNCDLWKGHRSQLDGTHSSAECINLFSSSDRGCLSAADGGVVEDAAFVSQNSKPASLRSNSCPAVTRKKPGVASNAPHLDNAQSGDIIIGKSTEV